MARDRGFFSALAADYGMIFALLLLGVFFSVATLDEQHLRGAEAAKQLAADIHAETGPGGHILIVVGPGGEDTAFATELKRQLERRNLVVVDLVAGSPADVRPAIVTRMEGGEPIDVVAGTVTTASWGIFTRLSEQFPEFRETKIMRPQSHRWPNFLKMSNLLNIANQISVIAIVAIGMTMVIITAGIDLSVGSLIALSAVVATRLIRDYAGAELATNFGMILGCLGGIAACAACGAFSGAMVTLFRIPSFIVTLGMMLVASGLAYILAAGQSISQVPDRFVWLGREADLFQLPNAVLLMLLLYILAHVMMKHTAFGRYIYAVGGNEEAARLSGVPVRRVLLMVYTCAGALAGLGGVIMASQLKSGAPTYGQMYELYVIAAVVVGGTSLAGGEGKIFGTLIGAFIIAVIQNGMNLTGVESYMQKVVLGLVILGAVLFDRLKRGLRT